MYRPALLITRFLKPLSSHRAMSTRTIGFLGFGNMGSHMATNLMKNGYNLMLYDVSEANTARAKQLGATILSSPKEVSQNTDIVITMLPAGKHVYHAYLEKDGLFEGARKDSIFVDCTTCEPTVSRRMADEAAKVSAIYLDSPVSGGVGSARDARLTFMVGGPVNGLDKIRHLLNIMGKNVIHCGDVGMGEAAKICNNMMLGIAMIGTSEAMSLGIALGIDPKKLASVLNVSSGRSWCSDTYNPCPGVIESVPSSNDYKGGFATGLMKKDLALAQNISSELDLSTPLGASSLHIYRLLCKKGYEHKDFSYIFKFLQE
ncbi:hypothetical protein LOD99_6679 [Oopsacas minuta]|uniref:3-hydroxyisobutyrate dehydrogenase n=1 Tax=Oopsacas minuta TaxID=111878 RepID=A0AAV7JMN3_9METZ|nr:hypothetical protein LOD99_6679 [Oopsacas minuta]